MAAFDCHRLCVGDAARKSMIALELSLRGLLRNFGLKVGAISRGRFELRIGELAEGNPMLEAATVMMHRGRSIWLRTWAAQLARRRGAKRAMVALARRIAVILHRMWVDDTDFRSDIPMPHAA